MGQSVGGRAVRRRVPLRVVCEVVLVGVLFQSPGWVRVQKEALAAAERLLEELLRRLAACGFDAYRADDRADTGPDGNALPADVAVLIVVAPAADPGTLVPVEVKRPDARLGRHVLFAVQSHITEHVTELDIHLRDAWNIVAPLPFRDIDDLVCRLRRDLTVVALLGRPATSAFGDAVEHEGGVWVQARQRSRRDP